MEYSAIVAPTIKEQFVRQIEDSILKGELAVGEQLPSEREMAEKMNISKTAVHSGIADMVRKGFLRVEPRRGIFVGDYAQNGTLEALASIMQNSGGSLDARNVRSILEMRCAIETLALRAVTKERSPEVIARLNALVDEAKQTALDESDVDYTKLAEIYFTFHHYICVASGNTIAPLIINSFKQPSVTFWANSAKRLGPKDSIERLEAFARLIEAGDVEGVCAHMQAITDSSEAIVKD